MFEVDYRMSSDCHNQYITEPSSPFRDRS